MWINGMSNKDVKKMETMYSVTAHPAKSFMLGMDSFFGV